MINGPEGPRRPLLAGQRAICLDGDWPVRATVLEDEADGVPVRVSKDAVVGGSWSTVVSYNTTVPNHLIRRARRPR